jgi:glycosyltransferase involved in cell wall biosynthesis
VELREALERLLEHGDLYEKLRAGCGDAMQRLGWGEPLQEMEKIYSGLARRPAA